MARDNLSIKCTTDKKTKMNIVETFRKHRIILSWWVLDRLVEKAEELKRDND